MKLFKTGGIDVVKDCLSCFLIDLPSCVCKKRQDKVHTALQFHSELNFHRVLPCRWCRPGRSASPPTLPVTLLMITFERFHISSYLHIACTPFMHTGQIRIKISGSRSRSQHRKWSRTGTRATDACVSGQIRVRAVYINSIAMQ